MAIRKKITFRNGDVFVGELSSSGALCKGTYTFANGDVYTGEYRRDWPEGKGKIEFKNGDVYEGEVKRGKPHGNGTYTLCCGDVYVGSFKKGLYSGEGKYYSDGEELIYSGAWKRDDKHGFGTEYYGDGGRYEGYFKRGLRHGYGKLIYPESNPRASAEGCFVRGSLRTDATLTYRDGRVYKGKLENGELTGRGSAQLKDGTFAKLEFDRDKIVAGSVTHIECKNGLIFDGETDDDDEFVRGSFTFPGGDTYKGEIKNNSFHG